MRMIAILIFLSLLVLSATSLADDGSSSRIIQADRSTTRTALDHKADSKAGSITGRLTRTPKEAFPGLMDFQGTLTDDIGMAMDTTVSMAFSIYDDSTGGIPVWTEEQPAVVVNGGVFSVLLGRVNAISDTVFSEPDRWLGVQVGMDPELEPRQRIASVGYAFRAGSDGDWNISGNNMHAAVSGNIGIGTTNPQFLLHSGSIASDNDITRKPGSSEVALSTGDGFGDKSSWIWREYWTGPTNWGLFHDNNADEIHTVGNSKAVVTVGLGSGRVGIGNMNPEYKLDVNGSARVHDSLYARSINSILYADQFPGSNAGEKIKAAIDSLPEYGGIVDARGIVGVDTISTNVFGSVGGVENLTLLLGHCQFYVEESQKFSGGYLLLIGQNESTMFLPTRRMNVLDIENAYRVHLAGFAINTNKTNSVAIELNQTANHNLLENIFINGPGKGDSSPLINIWGTGVGAEHTTLRNLIIWGSSSLVTGIYTGVHATIIENCTIEACEIAIEAYIPSVVTISGCYLGHCGKHFLLIECHSGPVNFINNRCEGTGEELIKIIGDNHNYPACDIHIEANLLEGLRNPSEDGIYLQHVDRIVIWDNTFKSLVPNSGANSIVFGPDVSCVSLEGNNILGTDSNMLGFEAIPLQIDDVTATQTSLDGGFSGNVDVGGQLTIDRLIQLHPSSAPENPIEGCIYMDSVTHKLMVFDGTAWKACW